MRRPLTGALLGIILGLAVAVVLQQEGIWPLDQLTVFLLPALLGLLGLLLLSMGREGSTVTLVIALLILLPMGVWGALGFGSINENGELNGGCEVAAQSAVDTTTVTDTSRQNPFEIDPESGLSWAAMSPFPFVDYDWSLYTEIGGFQAPLDSDHEDNEGMSEINAGDVPNVEEYAAGQGIDISQLRGVFIVGGDAADTCDGFAFVLLTTSSLFETLISKIALALIIVIIIIMIILMVRGRRSVVVESSTSTEMPDGAAGDSEIFPDGTESGDTSSWSDD